MGSGKTVLGQKLAQHINYDFVDLDQVLELQYKISVQDIFVRYGEDVFRKMEQKVLHESITLESTVISTGGGTPCFFDNMDFINSNGISVFLDLPVEVLEKRLKKSRKPRPLLENLHAGELTSKLETLYKYRLPFYRRAKVVISVDILDVDQMVLEVVLRLRKLGILSPNSTNF